MTEHQHQAATDPTDRQRLALVLADREHRIVVALRSLLHDWPALLTAPSSTGRASGKPGSRTPIGTNRLDLAESIPRSLAAWCEIVADRRQLRSVSLDRLDAPAMLVWLVPHARWLAALPADGESGDVVAELRQGASAVRAVVAPSGTKSIDVCPCPMPGCEGRVIAVLKLDEDEQHATCDVQDGHTWPQRRWEDLAALATDADARLPRDMTAPALAAWLSTHYRTKVTGSTIRNWCARHRDFPRPHHRTGLWPRMAVALWYLDHRAATQRAA